MLLGAGSFLGVLGEMEQQTQNPKTPNVSQDILVIRHFKCQSTKRRASFLRGLISYEAHHLDPTACLLKKCC